MKKIINATVCQFPFAPDNLPHDWARLVDHVRRRQSDLVLLPEMPFAPWFAASRPFDPAVWQDAVAAHTAWQAKFSELSPSVVLYSRPINLGSGRLNQAFVFDRQLGHRLAHTKYYLPDEPGYWEASWYERGPGQFTIFDSSVARLGFLICSDMWFFHHARAYGRAGAHLLAVPRCTPVSTLDKWLAGGRACATVAGSFCLSSNRAGPCFGGLGWIIDPDGAVLATTSLAHPFVTVPLDLNLAESAQLTYPRYLLD